MCDKYLIAAHSVVLSAWVARGPPLDGGIAEFENQKMTAT